MHARRGVVILVAALSMLATACTSGQAEGGSTAPGRSSAAGTSGPASATSTLETSGGSATASGASNQSVPSDQTHLHFVRNAATRKITPKSVQSNGRGTLIANNMMYTHTVTLYDAATMTEKAEVKDTINPQAMGVAKVGPGLAQGSPVEAAWTRDGRYAYVTNYTMYGAGFRGEGKDLCSPANNFHDSLVYRLDTEKLSWDKAIRVQSVPKFLALTPDQKHLLVANWCSFTVSVIDTATDTIVKTIPTGRNPRGIVVTPDSTKAYVACEGTGDIYELDLVAGTSRLWMSPGRGPRTILLSPDGKFMYATLTNADKMVKIDMAAQRVVGEALVGLQPRSMDISDDGTALYSVQFDEATVAKVRTSDMKLLEKRRTPPYPIGLAYEKTNHTVWVALYPGQMYVYEDSDTTERPEEDLPLTVGPVVGTGSLNYHGRYPTSTGVAPAPPQPQVSTYSTGPAA